MNAVIDFAPDGSVRCLYSELLPLSELGQLEVSRASNVEFNAQSQEWEVRLASEPGRVAFSHQSRSTCIAWEVETINNQLLSQ
jgi:hypothetical protein